MNYTSSVEEIINEMPFNKIFNSKELYIQYKLTMNEKTYYKIGEKTSNKIKYF